MASKARQETKTTECKIDGGLSPVPIPIDIESHNGRYFSLCHSPLWYSTFIQVEDRGYGINPGYVLFLWFDTWFWLFLEVMPLVEVPWYWFAGKRHGIEYNRRNTLHVQLCNLPEVYHLMRWLYTSAYFILLTDTYTSNHSLLENKTLVVNYFY